jgi:RimJ/RimL family protein N-acetyltransferase
MVAAEEDRRTYRFTYVPRAGEVKEYIRSQMAQAQAGQIVPFAQIRQADGRAMGCTTYREPRMWPERPDLCAIEIGGTWLAASAQRAGLNVEAKLLLMGYAFERLGVVRVDLKTDARNERSRRAIAALGAQFEGVLRSWSPSYALGEEGSLRDSALFSVLASEWPAVKVTLTNRLRRSVDPG